MSSQQFAPGHGGSTKDLHFDWHDDCVVLTVLLAATLSGKEMKRILVKHGYQELVEAGKTHLMLQALHAVCHQDRKVTARITKMLNGRYGNTVAKLKKLDEGRINQEALDRPWLAPYVWACYRHPDLEMRRVGRELAHAAVFRGMRKNENPDQLKAAREKTEKLNSQVVRLNRQLADLRQEHRILKSELSRKPVQASPKDAVQPLGKTQEQKELKKLRAQLSEQRSLLDKQAQDIATWRSMALSNQQSREIHPQDGRNFYDSGSHGCSPDPCDECAEQSLCGNPWGAFLKGRKVAIIGGLERLEPQYRDVIEQMGGSCLFSAGHTKSGGREFRKIVKKSDLVICITAINSHGAMKVVKKQCKLCRKPFCPLKGTSVGSLKNLLHEYAQTKKLPSMFESAN